MSTMNTNWKVQVRTVERGFFPWVKRQDSLLMTVQAPTRDRAAAIALCSAWMARRAVGGDIGASISIMGVYPTI